MNTYSTGEKVEIENTLMVNGVAINVSSLTITAIMVGKAGPVSTRVTCTKPGATGKVLATWPAAESSTWMPGRYAVEFWTTDGPFCHRMPEVVIVKGYAP
jgi:hypothetical protein